MSYCEGERVRFSDPHEDHRMIDGTFLNPADERLGEPSAAWVARPDSTTVRVLYRHIRPRGHA